jgi:hypothetical protein
LEDKAVSGVTVDLPFVKPEVFVAKRKKGKILVEQQLMWHTCFRMKRKKVHTFQ